MTEPTIPCTAWLPASGPRTSARRIDRAELLRAGTVWINCYNIFDAALPFGGYKQSGWGREMGHEVLEQVHRSEVGVREDLSVVAGLRPGFCFLEARTFRPCFFRYQTSR